MLVVLAHPDDESYAMGGTLARYADHGVAVHVAIATDGAAGSVDEKWEGDHTRLAEARARELEEASRVLGVSLHTLGYRDSGYIGDPAGQHPEAFVNADPAETTGRVVALIRELRPQVVVTHDETGGYFHPDHIMCWKITTAAFHAAGRPEEYTGIGPAPYQPERLYYGAFSNRWVRVLVTMMRLRGQDPRRAGRNRDIDFTRIGVPPSQLTTAIDFRRYWETKRRAGEAHGSQGGAPGFARLVPAFIQKLLFGHETYIRAYPPAPPGLRETDFFAGLS
jgi:LmbE family N-acetylglucosaminyl deacetylase